LLVILEYIKDARSHERKTKPSTHPHDRHFGLSLCWGCNCAK